MSETDFSIEIGNSNRLSAKTLHGLKSELEQERDVWKPFVDSISDDGNYRRLCGDLGWSERSLLLSLEHLVAATESTESFTSHKSAWGWGRSNPLPPSAASLEGQIIIGCWQNGHNDLAVKVLAAFLKESGLIRQTSQFVESLVARGQGTLDSVRAARSAPPEKAYPQKAATATRKLQAYASAAEEALKKIEKVNVDHVKWVDEKKKEYEEGVQLTRDKVVQKFKRFHARANQLLDGISADNTTFRLNRQKEVEAEVNHLARLRSDLRDDFDDLNVKYGKYLQYQRPVRLWSQRAILHRGNAFRSLFVFWALIGGTCILVTGLFYFGFGKYVSNSFFTVECDELVGIICMRTFSYEGPLLVGTLLLVTSLVLWMIRLQYRVYLSERHLHLNAAEKMAFAETYLALRGDETVGSDNEAIVLGALFRQSSDGMVKDEDSGMDVSVAAVIAKQLSSGGRT